MVDAKNLSSCKNKMSLLWEEFGLEALLTCLADIVHEDTNKLDEYGLFPSEVWAKRKMVQEIRNAIERIKK